MTAAEALRVYTPLLRDAEIANAERDARWLLAHAMAVTRDRLALHLVEDLNDDTLARFRLHIADRARNVPVSQIVGGRDFFGRWFKVTRHVLDPRPETEALIEAALAEPFHRVLDLGTGSGCILVTLLAELSAARGVGTDLSEEAVLVAGENALAHGVADRITLPLSDWWEDVGSTYDLIVSNPPYIAADEMAGLAAELFHEPRMALTDDADGLSAYRAIADGLEQHLTPGGRVLLEIGPSQAKAVRTMLAVAGLADIQVLPDLDGRDRVVAARKRRSA